MQDSWLVIGDAYIGVWQFVLDSLMNKIDNFVTLSLSLSLNSAMEARFP